MGRTRKYKRYSPEFKRDALKCARIYEEKTGKKHWYGGGLIRALFGDRKSPIAGFP